MIRLIQRRLIVPRGDTGTFSIPVLAGKDNGDASVFTIFDPLTHRKVFEKVMELSDGALTMDLTHGDTVNLPVGQYVWDIKFYTDAVFDEDGKVASGTEVDSYYAAFQLPICEIRETGDNLLLADDAPDARLAPDQINYLDLVRGQAEESAQNAANSAAEADTSATNAEGSASAAAASAQAAQDIETSVLAAQETASAAAVSAQSSADLASQKAAQIEADLANKADKSEIPTKVSDLVDDSGHYTKPATGIPASDLENTYVKFDNYASSNTAGVVKVDINKGLTMVLNKSTLAIAPANTALIKEGTEVYRPITSARQHETAFYGLAKAAGSDEKDSELPVGQYTDAAKAAIQQMLGVPSTADIPTNVSDLTNDAGYLTEHQDISGKAENTDLINLIEQIAPQYEDLSFPVEEGQYCFYNDTLYFARVRINSSEEWNLERWKPDTVANMLSSLYNNLNLYARMLSTKYTKPSTGIPASDLEETYLTEHQDISGKANIADLAAVATSGSYEDLSNKPTIPIVPVQDVQVDGATVLNSGIADIPIATTSSAGVIKIGDGFYYRTDPANEQYAKLSILRAGATKVKAGEDNYNPIVPAFQHQSVFYGLSKAAGTDLANEENITVGTYPAAAKTAIQNMLDVPSNATVTAAISTAIGNINSFDMAVVQALPTQDISTHTIYLVPKTGETNDVYDEYVYINSAWEMVGNTQVDLSNYVQKTDYATMFEPGVIQAIQMSEGSSSTYNGVALDTNHLLRIYPATISGIKNPFNKDYAPIVPKRQHVAAFYGLATAAGDTTQSQSDNEVGTYTTEAKAAIRSMIGAAASADISVQDVQIGGTSIVSNGIATIPVATKYDNTTTPSRLGLVNIGQGLNISAGGMLTTSYAATSEIKGETSYYAVITPKNVNVGVFYGLARAAGDTTQKNSNNSVGSYTDTAKGAIQKMLGISNLIAPEENDLVADQAYAIGDIFTSGGRLYKATSAIAFGGTIVPTTNCVETNVIDEVAAKLDAAEAGLKVVRLI